MAEIGGERVWHSKAVAEWRVPHSCKEDKIGRDPLRASALSPRPDYTVKGSGTGKINSHYLRL